MNVNQMICPNKYTEFHNGETVFYCKSDYILDQYNQISKLSHNVVLIVGNSDLPFTDYLFRIKPKNIKHIFANNSLILNDEVTPIPVGIENYIPSVRDGHGIINEQVFEKIPYMSEKKNIETKIDKLYANFNTSTNPIYREQIKTLCINSDNIDFETDLDTRSYFSKMARYLGIISPEGNGIECIRTFEILYSGGIPICVGDYERYQAIYEGIYKHLPVVYISEKKDLINHTLIREKIANAKKNSTYALTYGFWNEKISKTIKNII